MSSKRGSIHSTKREWKYSRSRH